MRHNLSRPSRACLAALAALAMGLAVAPSAAQPEPSFRSMGFLGSSGVTAANAVSRDGLWAVGQSTGSRGFLWSDTTGMVQLGAGPNNSNPVSSLPFGVADGGGVVVGSRQVGAGNPFPIRWTHEGGMENLGFLPGGTNFGRATAVSGDGEIVVGFSNLPAGPEAFRWTRETGIKGLGHLPGHNYSLATAISGDGRRIAGFSAATSMSDTDSTPCAWDDLGVLHPLAEPGAPGEFDTIATAISSSGLFIAGHTRPRFGGTPQTALRWSADGSFTSLGALSSIGFGSNAAGVSDQGWVVGAASTPEFMEAFLWTPERGMRPLASILVDELGLDLTGWTLTSANSISADGLTIVGGGRDPQGRFAAWIAVIPAPGSVAVLIGLGPLALRRGRPAGARR